ncbi:MAG: UPF0147 family protein [Candidatus Diapherotrites archaeon]|nr:UPF0147 family protein [Candidatus Diapherotrites archaeon]MDZ4256859.1 UPF0147 family protein [archaeon]
MNKRFPAHTFIEPKPLTPFKHPLIGCDALTSAILIRVSPGTTYGKDVQEMKDRNLVFMAKSITTYKNDIDAIAELMDGVLEDHSVPRNIRGAVEDAKRTILSAQDDVALSRAIYTLDDVSNDVNLPAHSRTDLWTIISELEALKEKLG